MGVALAGASAVPLAAHAQAAWPERPVTVVVGYSAGGAVDAVARTLGQALSKALGQPFVIENRPGAGTNIAVKSVIDAKPDGYTLLMAANALAANMALYKPQPFDAEKDLVPVALVGRVPVVIAANVNTPYTNIKQVIEAAKQKPNSIAYASPGNGSTPHMAAELFARAAGIDLMHVPYRGGAQAITDVIGGQVPLLAMNALEVKPQVAGGKLKVLATLTPQRTPIFPDAPTISEMGFRGFEASVWYALMAPAKTPTAVVERLHAEVQKALQSPEVRERMTAVGGEVLPGDRQMLASLLHSERVRYDKLVRDANIKPD
ncbi:tripartite tricarboxylate transporter substrate binding protein [Ramlibacter monticola]|uniref:Tripartite tricarboxylate transporter substrate binding protein n=2 Tax=Ramlibacter monticola TaxID=1926872 RepID=A0A936YYH1_9BURK|nr:tripartite tricarboxylate transporter substrate binding protein [Ramlibacter monticola]